MPLVEATLVSAHAQEPGLGEAIEAAMIRAITQAHAVGLSDPSVIHQQMQLARDGVLASWPLQP